MNLEINIKGLCSKFGLKYAEFLDDLDVENVSELTIYDLEAICEEYDIDLMSLLFKPMFKPDVWKQKLDKIKLLVLDVDGVMTDGGMYYSENGDQIKKFNTKDGMAIQHLTKNGYQVAIISSGYTTEMIQKRAELLGVQRVYVGRDPKLTILNQFCEELGIELNQVAIIGDDVNDLPVIKKVGFSAAPSDAMNTVKSNVDVILSKKGGDGCVREFIDAYILAQPLN
jgi:3-deoxy-D-manno-octulosonate 8-phosphate phosphatase (KDO 8-P phosphatase)